MLEVAGRRLVLSLTAQRATPEVEIIVPDRQGATCGDLERAPSWDHDARTPIGFRKQ